MSQVRLGTTEPDLPDFLALAPDHRVIPVTRRLLADTWTPVGLFQRLAGQRAGTFLLESAEHGGTWSRWSIVGVASRAVLTERRGQAVWLGDPPVGAPTGDPLAALAGTLELLRTPRLPGLPPLTGGLVGFLGYDVVRRLERLPELTSDETGLPELALLLATDLAVYDHRDGTVVLVANAVNGDGGPDGAGAAHADAVRRLDAMTSQLAEPGSGGGVWTADLSVEPHPTRRRSAADHRAAVLAAQHEIRAGEAFQVVVSQRFDTETSASGLDVYRVLRATNPSPYMYLLRLPPLQPGGSGPVTEIVGSSPEALVKVVGEHATTRPIAGTMPRGQTPEQDAERAAALLADEKERAEHVMLVDLGRNDLARVCRPGTVEVVDFCQVVQYSHVMHLESTVVGQLAPGRTGLDALLACFPAGTLSGAPKPRAMEIIEKLEPTRRGVYGGIVGYLDFAGDVDSAIAIRTAVLRDGQVQVQAGGGIVADSDPDTEEAETRHKAAAALRAVAAAATLTEVGATGTSPAAGRSPGTGTRPGAAG